MKRVQEKCRIRKTGNMKKVQHKMSATKSNKTKGTRWKKVQHGKSATWKEPTQKKYNMSRFQHEATSKKIEHEESAMWKESTARKI